MSQLSPDAMPDGAGPVRRRTGKAKARAAAVADRGHAADAPAPIAVESIIQQPSAPATRAIDVPTLRDVFIAEARGDPEVALVARRVPIRFDPESWLRDRALRGCSAAARGIWMDVLCLMHTSPVYGKLLGPDRNPYTYTDLAAIMSVDRRTVKAMMEELLQRGVYDIDPELSVPVSRRMRRDLAISASSNGPVSGDRVLFPGRIHLPGVSPDVQHEGGNESMSKHSRATRTAPGQADLFATPVPPSVESFVRSIDPEAREALASGGAAQRYFEESQVDMPQSGVSGGSGPAISNCPVEALLEAYNTHSGLASVRVSQFMRNSARRARLERRWQECFKRNLESSVLPFYGTVHAGIESWTFLFKAVRDMPGLHGGFGSWTADFDWIIGRENFDKLIYHPDRYRRGAGEISESSAVEAFVAAYPKARVGMRKDVLEAWVSLGLDKSAEAVMSGLDTWKRSGEWLRDDGRYIPSARRFLVEARYLKIPPASGDADFSLPGAHAATPSSRVTASAVAMRKVLRLGSHPDESGDWRVVRFERMVENVGLFALAYLVSENKIVVESAPPGIRPDSRALRYLRETYGNDRVLSGAALYDKLHPYVRGLADAAVGRLCGGPGSAAGMAPTAAEEAGVLAWASLICPDTVKGA